MKIICSKDSLVEAINTVQKAIPARTTLPILEGVLIEANDVIKMTGNDLELAIESFVEGDIKSKGSIVVNSKMFGEVIRRLPDSEVLIEVNTENSVLIECENCHFKLTGIASAGYPVIPNVEMTSALVFDQFLVKDMIRRTIFAVGEDTFRPIFTGSLFECSNNELTIVSLDGSRIALRKTSAENSNIDIKVIIPGKTLNEISKILTSEGEIKIFISQNQILFDSGKFKVVSRLLEGGFLNYKYLINNDYQAKVKVKTKELLSSIERAILVALEDHSKTYPVKLSVLDEKIIISSESKMGSVIEEIHADMQGDTLEINYNPRYFIDALRTIDDDVIDVYFSASPGACTIKPFEGDSFAHVILSLRG